MSGRGSTQGGVRWKTVVCGPRPSAGDDLDAARPGPDHADPFPVESDRVVPTSRVDECALERLDAVDGGRPGLGEHAGGEDDDLAAHRSPVVGADGPVPVVLGPLSGRRPSAGSQVRPHPAVIGAPLEVLEDLGASRVGLESRKDWGRTRTSRGGRARRTPHLDMCCAARCHRCRRCVRGSRSRRCRPRSVRCPAPDPRCRHRRSPARWRSGSLGPVTASSGSTPGSRRRTGPAAPTPRSGRPGGSR